MRFFLSLLLAASFAGAAAADGEANGADVYNRLCGTCHGADGQANTPVAKAMKVPPLATPEVANASDAELAERIKANPKHASALGKLSDEDLQMVIQYVKKFGAP